MVPEIGKKYLINHNGFKKVAKCKDVYVREGFGSVRKVTRYIFENTITGREIILKSHVPVLREVIL